MGLRRLLSTLACCASFVATGFVAAAFAASHDFNADARSDILWRNGFTGQTVVWLINGTAVIGGGSPGSAAISWQIIGQRDFNADGRADLLWRNNTTGEVVIWFLNGASVIGGGSLGTVNTDWAVVGLGDFNGDGRGDIVWQHSTTGQVLIWLLNGATVIGGGSPGSFARPVVGRGGGGCGEGKTDVILWDSTTGQGLVLVMVSGRREHRRGWFAGFGGAPLVPHRHRRL